MWHPDFCCRVYWRTIRTGMYYRYSGAFRQRQQHFAEAPKNPQQNLLNGRCFFWITSKWSGWCSVTTSKISFVYNNSNWSTNFMSHSPAIGCERMLPRKIDVIKQQHGELTTLRRNHQKPNSSNSSWFVFYCFFFQEMNHLSPCSVAG